MFWGRKRNASAMQLARQVPPGGSAYRGAINQIKKIRKEAVMMRSKMCPECNGDVFDASDELGLEGRCVRCGWSKTGLAIRWLVDAAPASTGAVLVNEAEEIMRTGALDPALAKAR